MLTTAQAEHAPYEELLDFDPSAGVFRWRINRGGKALAGTVAGTPNHAGHVRIRIGKRKIPAGRLAWLFSRGDWPPEGLDIDHINGDPADNRPSNLRLATRSQNSHNAKLSKTNRSGFKGVHWHKQAMKWQAGIQLNGRYKSLGLFSDPVEAGRAYAYAAIKYRGEFARC